MALTDHVGGNLRRLRRARDLTQTQVGTLAHLSQPYVSAIENGLRPRCLDHVEALAKALVVSTEALLARPPSRGEVKKKSA